MIITPAIIFFVKLAQQQTDIFSGFSIGFMTKLAAIRAINKGTIYDIYEALIFESWKRLKT